MPGRAGGEGPGSRRERGSLAASTGASGRIWKQPVASVHAYLLLVGNYTSPSPPLGWHPSPPCLPPLVSRQNLWLNSEKWKGHGSRGGVHGTYLWNDKSASFRSRIILASFGFFIWGFEKSRNMALKVWVFFLREQNSYNDQFGCWNRSGFMVAVLYPALREQL